jgi:hypothetical protein
VCDFACIGKFLNFYKNEMRKLTNTFKLTHRNRQTTNETLYLNMEEFHTGHALSLYIFIYALITTGPSAENNESVDMKSIFQKIFM